MDVEMRQLKNELQQVIWECNIFFESILPWTNQHPKKPKREPMTPRAMACSRWTIPSTQKKYVSLFAVPQEHRPTVVAIRIHPVDDVDDESSLSSSCPKDIADIHIFLWLSLACCCCCCRRRRWKFGMILLMHPFCPWMNNWDHHKFSPVHWTAWCLFLLLYHPSC